MASRKEEKERLRQERIERERAAAQAAGRRKRLGLIVAAVVGVAAVAAVIALALGGGDDGGGGGGGGSASADFPKVEVPARKVRDLEDAAKAAGCTLSEPENEGAEHVETPVRYKSNPPTSGNHSPTSAGDGVFPDGAPTGELVHSLEHGRVVLQYAADAAPRVRGALKAVYDEDKAITILTKNLTKMPHEVAATAWDKLLACPSYNDRVPDALRAFREENRLKGPEFVPNMEPPAS